MPIDYDLKTLTKMTPEARFRLYENCRARIDKGGREIMKRIDDSGLPLCSPSGGTKLTDPIYIAMSEIIWSKVGREEAIAAAGRHLPAMAGVDPLLQNKLGDQYRPVELITASAGSIVGELMRHLGYKKGKQMPLPAGCVAKTATMWLAPDRAGQEAS